MKIKHLLKESLISISQENDGGSLEGYVVDTDQPQLKNYLSGHHVSTKLIVKLVTKFKRIAIIKNLYVDEDYRNKGFGRDLLDHAIDSAYEADAEAILLIADTEEQNAFDLIQWYKNYGFEIIGHGDSNPIMLLNES